MKLKNILLLLFCVTTTVVNISASNAGNDNKMQELILSDDGDVTSHKVVKGETVYSIASAYNTTVQEIYKLNPSAAKSLREGDVLQLPKNKKPAGYSSHTVEAKETLFSVSKMYNITVDDLKNANPSLDEDTFQVGRTIRIPFFSNETTVNKIGYVSSNKEYKVGKGETLYSISKANGVSVEAITRLNPSAADGLREGMLLLIPQKQIEPMVNIDQKIPELLSEVHSEQIVRIGILLPFLENQGNIQKDKLVEYYEGFLLAVREMKQKGLNAEIYTFNIGSNDDTQRLNGLLGTSELSNLNLIIGGTSKQQIDILSSFCKKNGTKYVVPFESRNTNVEFNEFVFQMINSHSNLYPQITTAFVNQFRDRSVVFVAEKGSNNDKADFVAELKKELSKAGISYKTVGAGNSLSDELTSTLSGVSKSILIPTSSSESTLRQLASALKSSNATGVSLFGYPEWQTYTQQVSNLYQNDTYIYSIFFLNEKQKEVIDFVNQYKKWYNTDLINSYPKYGVLGYDTGLFFLTALYGDKKSFENGVSQLKVATLQSAIHFNQPNDKGGFVNNGLYFVHYKTNQTIEKTDISR